MSELILEARKVSKFFPGVKALQSVSLQMQKGSIHALLGENGAGKSTLIKIITGVYRPDEGGLFLDGKPIELASPREAIAHRIGVVHQERNLIPRFSVAENIHLERLAEAPLKPIDYSLLNRMASEWLDELGLDIDPSTPVSKLSVAKMQLVEIAKALSMRSRVLLLDEPTASLTAHETDILFALLEKLKNNDTSILFVSHKLEEVQAICDSVTVLRDGQNACDSRPMEGLDRQDIVRMMIGRSEQIAQWSERDRQHNKIALQLKNVSTALGHKNVDLTVRHGEIVGLYGLVGAGRTELAKCILGQFPITSGTVELDGTEIHITSVADAIHNHRIGYVSEDRKQEGLILLHSVLGNAGISIWRRMAGWMGFLADSKIQAETIPFINKLEVKTPSLSQIVGNLSGGNQQKISVAKWLAAGVKLLIIDEPSVGIDIKTKAYLHDLIRELSDNGTAILLITSDLPEMISLADRIVTVDNYTVEGEVINTGKLGEMSEAVMNSIHKVEPSDRPVEKNRSNAPA